MINKDVYTLKQTSEIFHVHEETLRRWDRSGKLPAHRTPSGRRYYTEDDINNYFNMTKRNNIKNKIIINDDILVFISDKSQKEQAINFMKENNINEYKIVDNFDKFINIILFNDIKQIYVNNFKEFNKYMNDLDFLKKILNMKDVKVFSFNVF